MLVSRSGADAAADAPTGRPAGLWLVGAALRQAQGSHGCRSDQETTTIARTAKLNDLQLILLATAAQRADGSLLPPPDKIGDQGARIRRALPPLIKRELVEEIDVTGPAQAWRSDGDRHIGAIITDAGRAIIAAEEVEAGMPAAGEGGDAALPAISADPVPPAKPESVALPSAATPRPASKIAQVLALLQRDGGATLDELVAATGWLPHTTRAALTGLRKKGHTLDKRKRGEVTCYKIGEAA